MSNNSIANGRKVKANSSFSLFYLLILTLLFSCSLGGNLDDWRSLKDENDDLVVTATPTVAASVVSKDTLVQKSVVFTLTSTHTGIWRVYNAETGGIALTTVEATFAVPYLTLTASGSDLAVGTYFVSVEQARLAESSRLAFTVVTQEQITIYESFNTSGSYTYSLPSEVTFPATIEIYVLGGGGGGQGGSYTYHFLASATYGTGGAGGGGAAAYMKFDVSSSVSLSTTIGKGGTGGNGHSPSSGAGNGFAGETGGSTTVTWGSNTLTVIGGQGGGVENRNLRSGGNGGGISTRPSVITDSASFWDTAPGCNGENGVANETGINGFGRSQGGRAGALNIGSWGSFGGAAGGYNYNVTAARNYATTSTGIGAGGPGGFSGDVRGFSGGNGLVIICITYYKSP